MIGTAHFRFLNLSKEQAKELETSILNVEIDVHYKTGKHVGSIELIDTRMVVEINEFRINQSIAVRDCDIFVSISSDKHDELWRAPKTVNYVVNIVNCPIVFSYTC
ncbi:MAG: hypothetical protein L3J46_02255 [Kangiellaceae bacterium]|nr:hypothetical protein [Kangiellaceae bacterium]